MSEQRVRRDQIGVSDVGGGTIKIRVL